MSTLYVDKSGCQLSLSGKVLSLHQPDAKVRHIPAGLLDRVVLRADTGLTSRVLTGLAELGVGVLMLGGRRGERMASVLGAPHKDVRSRITQVRRLDDLPFQQAWCRYLLDAKLRTQHRLLSHALAERPALRKPLTAAMATLVHTRAQLPAVVEIERMRGLEGAGAAAYFGAYTRLFPASLGFGARQRRPPPDPVNACLSLGYTLLLGLAVEACHAQGLDPHLGYLHLPCHGRPSLACDLMEPWRARVDTLVWQLFRSRQLEASHFGGDGHGACLLGKTGRARYYEAWASQDQPLRRALRRHARLATTALGNLAAASMEANVEEGSA